MTLMCVRHNPASVWHDLPSEIVFIIFDHLVARILCLGTQKGTKMGTKKGVAFGSWASQPDVSDLSAPEPHSKRRCRVPASTVENESETNSERTPFLAGPPAEQGGSAGGFGYMQSFGAEGSFTPMGFQSTSPAPSGSVFCIPPRASDGRRKRREQRPPSDAIANGAPGKARRRRKRGRE